MQILVPVSGGKDSQACLKLAVQKYGPDRVEGLFCDTQFEHPLTYQHIENIKELYGNVRIHRISGGSVVDKVLKYGRFPSFQARHCTDELKIRETKMFLKEYAEIHTGGVQVWYGMRKDESSARAKRYSHIDGMVAYQPHEVIKKYPKYLGKMGVRYVLPLADWTEDDVFDFLDGEENPLYDMGFDRVGCFPCLASGDKWKNKAFEMDDFGREQRKVISIVEEKIGKSVFDSVQNPTNYQGCKTCEYS